jgi:hypothetical protein
LNAPSGGGGEPGGAKKTNSYAAFCSAAMYGCSATEMRPEHRRYGAKEGMAGGGAPL